MNARDVAARIQAKTLHNAAWKGNRLSTRCPAHQDKNPSLSITEGQDGRVLVKCHGGCETDAVCAAVGLKISDLMPDNPPQATSRAIVPKGVEVAAYAYQDEEGKLLFEVVRLEPKGFRQRRPDPTNPNKRLWNKEGVRNVPYRLPELIGAKAKGNLILIVEGEKDADNLAAWNYCASCNAGGAGKWTEENTACLGKAEVVIIPDNDDAGRSHAEKILHSVAEHGNRVWVLHLPTVKAEMAIKDFSDWQAAGGTKEELQIMLDTIRHQPPALARGTNSVISVSSSLVADGLGGMREWPKPPGEEAFQGLLGDVAKTLGPYTEADPAALLIHTLVMFGNVVGRNPHWTVNATRHGCNLFAVCVGPTGAARKGTAADLIQDLLEAVDSKWAAGSIKSGLVSSEGLLYHVRDANDTTQDKGVSDKRLLVLESEFGRLLNTMQRHGSTLSAELRKAWDGKRMESLAKNCPLIASEAHVSIIGHIVRDELLAGMQSTDVVNGFGNRLLYACVRRDKELPFGGEAPGKDKLRLVKGLADAFGHAKRQNKPIDFAPDAKRQWIEAYSKFHRPIPGIIGSLLQRGDAICRRVAMVYALADRSPLIQAVHLQAALALWKYAEASARYVFGETSGNRVAERIKGALMQSDKGLTRTEINAVLGGNVAAGSIDDALRVLDGMQQIDAYQEIKSPGEKGRPATRIRWRGPIRWQHEKTE
jgi:hypothetical protein